jgi:hypothetical protein
MCDASLSSGTVVTIGGITCVHSPGPLQFTRDAETGLQMQEGFIPSLVDPSKGGGILGRGIPGLVWHALDVRYDQCVGNGEYAKAASLRCCHC